MGYGNYPQLEYGVACEAFHAILTAMKALIRPFLVMLMAGAVTGCLFKEPVFEKGFQNVDPALAGVWATVVEGGDPRETEFAVCAPVDETRSIINYPAGSKDALYFEARALEVHGRSLLQLRILASFSEGLPKPDAQRYTLLWVEKEAGGANLRVRALKGDGEAVKKGPAEVKRLLEDPGTDWLPLFDDAIQFRRLKDK